MWVPVTRKSEEQERCNDCAGQRLQGALVTAGDGGNFKTAQQPREACGKHGLAGSRGDGRLNADLPPQLVVYELPQELPANGAGHLIQDLIRYLL
jgi:hypothetical protein